MRRGRALAARAGSTRASFLTNPRGVGFRLLGRLEMAQGNLPAAGAAFDQSYRADPANAGLWVDIGRLRYPVANRSRRSRQSTARLAFDPAHAEALRFPRPACPRRAWHGGRGHLVEAGARPLHPTSWKYGSIWPPRLSDAGRAPRAGVLRGAGRAAVGTPAGCSYRRSSPRAGAMSRSRAICCAIGSAAGSASGGACWARSSIWIAATCQRDAGVTLDRAVCAPAGQCPRGSATCWPLPCARSAGERELVHRFAVSSPTIPHRPICAHWSAALTRRWATEHARVPRSAGDCIGPRRTACRAFRRYGLRRNSQWATLVLAALAISCGMPLRSATRCAAVRARANFAAACPARPMRRRSWAMPKLAMAIAPPRAPPMRAARIRQGWPLALRLARAGRGAARAVRCSPTMSGRTR